MWERKPEEERLQLPQLSKARYKRASPGEKVIKYPERRIPGINAVIMSSAALRGVTVTQSVSLAADIGLAAPSRSSHVRWHRTLWPELEALARTVHKDEIARLVAAGKPLTLVGDGGWSQRRNANQHCLILMCGDKPVHVVAVDRTLMRAAVGGPVVWHKGNFDAGLSSNVMETAAWRRVAAELDAIDPTGRFRQLVTKVCVDRDNKVPKIIKVLFSILASITTI